MAAGISIGIASDTRAFVQGIKSGVLEPLEDAEKALKNVSKAGDNAGDDLEKSLRESQKDTKKLGDEFEKLADTIKTESRKAGKDLDRNIKEGTDGGKEGLKDFKDEAASTARESAASFDGSAESIGDAFQEVAANAFGGFGPVGAAAGLAVAAGVGIGFANIEKRAEEMESFVSDLFDDMIESGQNYASSEFINSQIKEIVQDKEKMKEIDEDSNRLSLESATLIRAQAGDQAALNDVIAAEEAAHQAAIDKINESTISTTEKRAKVGEENQEHQTTIGLYEGIQNGINSTKAAQEAYNGSAQTGADKVQNMKNILDGINDKTVTLNANTAPIDEALREITSRKVTVFIDLQNRKTDGVVLP